MGNLLQGEGNRTGHFAGMAGNAPLLVPVDLYKAEPVEPAINYPQRTQVLAEGMENLHREQENSEQTIISRSTNFEFYPVISTKRVSNIRRMNSSLVLKRV